MRICVTGATGFVGSRLVPALLAEGHDLVAIVRDADAYDPPDGVDVVEGDLLEQGSFESALTDVDAAYYLVHSMGMTGDFASRDRQAARHFRDGVAAAGVERVVYLSGLGGEEAEELSAHLASRREVESVLEHEAYDLTVLRAAIVVGADSASFDIVVQLAHRLPVMITPQWVRTPCQPIAIDDAIAYLTGVLDAPETAGGTFEIGGPSVLTYQEMLRTTARLMGRHLYIVPVPLLSPKLSTYWIDIVTDVPRAVAAPLVEGLRTPMVVTDDRIREYVDLDRTDFETAARRALSGREGIDLADPQTA